MKIAEVNTYVLGLEFRFRIAAMPPLQASGLLINLKKDEDIEGWDLSHWNLSNNTQKESIDETLS